MTEHTAFGTLTIAFDDRVLRPREWTTAQSVWAADLMDQVPPGPVLELCAGAGQIGLLAVAGTHRRLLCVDASPVACDYVRANAQAAGLAELVEVRNERLQHALAPEEMFPLVVADPPWVPREETGRFPEDPLLAIDGGVDGLDVARACVEVIADHLVPGGAAVLQIGSSGQVRVLGDEPAFADGRLVIAEVRQQARGVLVRIDRPA
jgi:methylase of polypeptide subunit release factors